MHHVLVILAITLIASAVGGFLGLKLGGIYTDRQGQIRNASRPQLARIFGGFLALLCCSFFHASVFEGVVAIALSIFLSKQFCSYLFFKFLWKNGSDDRH